MEIEIKSEELIIKRKTKSENQIICHICGKMYTSIKSLIKHEINHEDTKLNTKVKIKTQVKKCKLCSYESDRKSSIIK